MRAEEPAAHARIVAEGRKIANGRGNFWRIEREGVAPSYLLGTFHSPLAIPHVSPEAWQALQTPLIRHSLPDNRKTLEALFRYSFEQGLASRELTVEELFFPGSLEWTEA